MPLPNFDKVALTPFPSLGRNSPNIQFKSYVNHSETIKTVDVAISITNLLPLNIEITVARLFDYILASVNSDLNPSVAPPTTTTANNGETDSSSTGQTKASDYLQPIIHCELDSQRQEAKSLSTDPVPPDVVIPLVTTIIKTVSIDVLIGNLQRELLAATFAKMKAYLLSTIKDDMNPII